MTDFRAFTNAPIPLEQRIDALERLIEGWVTINGTHVFIGDDGAVTKGPSNLIGSKPPSAMDSLDRVNRDGPVNDTFDLTTAAGRQAFQYAKNRMLPDWAAATGSPNAILLQMLTNQALGDPMLKGIPQRFLANARFGPVSKPLDLFYPARRDSGDAQHEIDEATRLVNTLLDDRANHTVPSTLYRSVTGPEYDALKAAKVGDAISTRPLASTDVSAERSAMFAAYQITGKLTGQTNAKDRGPEMQALIQFDDVKSRDALTSAEYEPILRRNKWGVEETVLLGHTPWTISAIEARTLIPSNSKKPQTFNVYHVSR